MQNIAKTLSTWEAASYIAEATRNYTTDWYNVLQENRRETFSFSKKYGLTRKGNQHRYDWLRCEKVGRQYVYDKENIDKWLQDSLKIVPFMPKHNQVPPTLLHKVQSFAAKHGVHF